MATLEQVEKLRKYANITYDEAKQALDISNGDMLEAIIYLERMGKVEPPENGGYYSSAADEKKGRENTDGQKADGGGNNTGEQPGETAKRFFAWLSKVIHKANTNMFEVRRRGGVIISIPISVLIILLIACFWFIIPLIVIGLFFGCRYRFCGKDFEPESVNKAMDSASDFAEDVKREVRDEVFKDKGKSGE